MCMREGGVRGGDLKAKQKEALVESTFSGFFGNVRPSEMLGHLVYTTQSLIW